MGFKNDEFVFQFKSCICLARSLKTTKRNILKVGATLYDPLGLISPITSRVKTIFQLLCKDHCEWDDTVSKEVEEIWFEYLSYLDKLGMVKVKRFVFIEPEEKILSVTLHGFCDSSSQVYCGVVYLQIETSVGVKISLLCSKTKVAPLKKLSIPRLELLGCVLLSKVFKDGFKVLNKRVCVDGIFCWTDSEVALCWIKGKEKCWKPWVENRVVSIRSVVDRDNWFHIAGVNNPVDIPTRVCKLSDLERWFKGPEFLYSNFEVDEFDVGEKWKLVESVVESEMKVVKKNLKDAKTVHNFCFETFSRGVEVSDEVLKVVRDVEIEHVNNLSVVQTSQTVTEKKDVTNSIYNVIDITRFSSLKKLIMVTGYVFRFINNLKSKIKTEISKLVFDNVLTFDEYERAINLWVVAEQEMLKRQSDFMKLKTSLKLFNDSFGLLRLKGRFENALMNYEEKHPLILRSAADSYFTKLIIIDAHEKVLHHGIETTLNCIRSKFWIVRGRKAVKGVLRKCVTCRRYQGRTMLPPESPDLPDYRVNSLFAFQFTGLDYAGPLYIKTKKDSVSKVYILLFTCASSRALHLELSPDMKVAAFIRAFKRFTARRGKPDITINDNFKTFKSSNVKKYMLYQGVRQQFILPASPWWGGFYERLVRSVKISLKKVLGKALLTYEELETVLCEIESVINNRPLFYTS